MNIHQKYRSEKLDDIFCYFMKTILRLEKTGIGSLPVEFEGEEPVKGFLMLSMRLLTEAEPPETTRLITLCRVFIRTAGRFWSCS